MKRFAKVLALLLAILLTASGCAVFQGGAEPTEAPTETPAPTPAPTEKPYTPEPTITPRTLAADVEMPEGGATPLLIHPIDEPTRPPLVFNSIYFALLIVKTVSPSLSNALKQSTFSEFM